MNLLVITEDFRTDQYVALPIVQAMAEWIELPGKIRVLQEILGGYDQATDAKRLEGIVARYPMVDVFILLVDRDGRPNRRLALANLEKKMNATGDSIFLAEHAIQELETWVLAGHDLLGDWTWEDVREEKDVKEHYFYPFAKERGVLDEPGQGRKLLGVQSGKRYERVRQLCKEDVGRLEERLSLVK